MTARKLSFECAIWLDEMKCHLVVTEIPLPVTTENKDQALTCIRRSRVGSPLPVFCWHHLEVWEFLGRKYFHSTK